MGRKSYEEIGHPSPNRMNIVVSTTTEYQGDNLVSVKSLEDALLLAKGRDVYISGGYGLFKEALQIVDKNVYHRSRFKIFEDGDTFFPDVLFLSSKKKAFLHLLEIQLLSTIIDLKYSFRILEYSFISQLQQFSSQYKEKIKRIFSKDILPVFIVFSFIHGISTISYSSNFPLNLLQFPPDKGFR